MRHLLVDGELFLGGGLEVAGAATVGAPLVVCVLGDNSIEFQHTFHFFRRILQHCGVPWSWIHV